jgi:hypothetical protein
VGHSFREGSRDLGHTPEGTVQCQGDAIDSRSAPGVEVENRQAEFTVPLGLGQPNGTVIAQSDHQRKAGRRNMRQPDDPEAANLQQPGEGGRRAGVAVLDLDPIIGDEVETAAEESQHEIGLA